MLLRFGFRCISALTGVLPRRWQYAFSRPMCDLYYCCASRTRRTVLANLAAVLDDDRARTAAHGIFRSFGMYLCEFFGVRHLRGPFIDANVTVTGREHLDTALTRGRGVIFCSAHYSNWELGALVVAHLGYPITAVVAPHADARTNALFVQQRVDGGVTVVATQNGARNALRALGRNETVALMGDRPTGGPTLAITFFGRPMRVPQGPWRIALSSGASILPTFMHREPDGRFLLEFKAPLEPSIGTLEARMEALAQAWARAFEERLRADPTQWAAFYNVWQDGGE